MYLLDFIITNVSVLLQSLNFATKTKENFTAHQYVIAFLSNED